MRSFPAERERRRPRRCWTAAAALIVSVALVQCDLIVPRQGWSEKWGPLVPHETFPTDCGICHVPRTWNVIRDDFTFDHEAETGYALEGAHSWAACLRCHNDRGPLEVYLARGCRGCHVDPHSSDLGVDCTRCHNQRDWRPGGAVADHARTRFPLVGVHSVVACESCHLEAPVGDFRGAPTSCDLCHRSDLVRATSPDHTASGWTKDCERCHTPLGWGGGNFRHDFFPLVGGHAGVDCFQCHTNGTLRAIPRECYSCHQDDYEAAPNHVTSRFPRDCSICHSTSRWSGAVVNHGFFPLVGGHAGLDCVQCHTSGTLEPVSAACFSCHQSDYQSAPEHAAEGYSTDCTRCHSIATWEN